MRDSIRKKASTRLSSWLIKLCVCQRSTITGGGSRSALLVEGGSALNVVPACASAKVDVRFWTPEDGENLVAAIRGLTPVTAGAKIEVSGGINRPPMPRSEKNIALFEHARALAAELGFELKDEVVGGGSDGNFIAAMGVPTLDGLGVDGALTPNTNTSSSTTFPPRDSADTADADCVRIADWIADYRRLSALRNP